MEIKPFNYFMYIGMAVCLVQLSFGLDLSAYAKLNKEVGKRLKSYDPEKSLAYPQEYGFGYYYEGDILLKPNAGGRFAITTETAYDLWPNATVPYEIEAFFNDEESKLLQEAFAQFANRTCIRFVPRKDEVQYIRITNEQAGCAAHIGRLPFPLVNNVNLETPTCMNRARGVGTPVHELMHALGFFHEHSRPDRDEYIEILIQNLDPEYQNARFIRNNLSKRNENDGTSYGVSYDYGSVMHYSRFAGAISRRRPVFVNKKPWVGNFGNSSGLSESNVQQLNYRYCPE